MIRLSALIAALVIAAFTGLYAVAGTVGTPPGTGFALQDGNWLNGLAGGQNHTFTNGLTAHAGGTQAAGLQLPANTFLIEIDTVATTSDSVLLPFCIAPQVMIIINSGANTMNVYASPNTNAATATTDTIDGNSNATAFTIATKVTNLFKCAKSGNWFH